MTVYLLGALLGILTAPTAAPVPPPPHATPAPAAPAHGWYHIMNLPASCRAVSASSIVAQDGRSLETVIVCAAGAAYVWR